MTKTAQPHISSSYDSSATLHAIRQMALEAGVPLTDFMSSLQQDLKRTADPQRALNNVHRFLSAGFSATTLRDFHRHRVLQRVALELFAQSQYLSDILVRNPELFGWLTSTGALGQTSAKSTYLEEARTSTVPFERFDKKLNALRRFQRRELLRIGAREVLKEVDVTITAEELSRLADSVVTVVLELVTTHLLSGSEQPFQNSLAVIGLGKLGGGELNFSSDIDLLFVYDQDGEFDVPQLRVKTFHELYARVAELTVRKLAEHTDEGHFYRVDLRLRPEGIAGPIALPRSAAMNYYEARGEPWERQMLIKARVVAGNAAVGERFLLGLQPFIYPRTQLGSPLDEIAAMKRKIEAKTNSDSNIKLGSGGIRDIEFIVQALQLLNAGKNEQLRERNTLNAIDCLASAGRMNDRESSILHSAYTFFRTVEHRLQLFFGKQTHSLPQSEEEMDFLAKRLGFRSTALFQKKLDAARSAVRKIFASVFNPKETRASTAPAARSSGAGLRRHGFSEPLSAEENLANIVGTLPELSDEKLQQKLLLSLKKYKAPDWGLQNFSLLVNNPHLRRSLLQALSNDGPRDLIALICSRSVNLARLLASEPLLFETLLSNPRSLLGEGLSWELLKSDLTHYHAFNEFRIVLRWLTGNADIIRATGEFTLLADEIVSRHFDELVLPEAGGVPVALCTVGKYGGREITTGSDLDLLFVYRKVDDGTARRAEKLARRFSGSFADSTGSMYNIDMRLRPEGKNAPLAVEISYYREYLQHRASLWERQSLVKFRIVAGDEQLAREMTAVAEDTVYHAPLPRGWVDEVSRMRNKIEHERAKDVRASDDLKVGRGGLVDIEFMLQLLQLRFGVHSRRLRASNSFVLLANVRTSKLLPKREVKQLQENLGFLRSLETLVRLNSVQNSFVLPGDKRLLIALAAGMGQKSVRSLLTRIRAIQQSNRKLLHRVYRLCKRT